MPARCALVLAGLFALTLLLSACGGASEPGTVKVYFCTTVSMPDCKSDATPVQEQAVGRALRSVPNVTKVVFISKSAALEQLKKDNPDLVKGLGPELPANPLPDEWVVTVASDRDSETVGKAICAAHYAGVERCKSPDRGGVQWGSVFDH